MFYFIILKGITRFFFTALRPGQRNSDCCSSGGHGVAGTGHIWAQSGGCRAHLGTAWGVPDTSRQSGGYRAHLGTAWRVPDTPGHCVGLRDTCAGAARPSHHAFAPAIIPFQEVAEPFGMGVCHPGGLTSVPAGFTPGPPATSHSGHPRVGQAGVTKQEGAAPGGGRDRGRVEAALWGHWEHDTGGAGGNAPPKEGSRSSGCRGGTEPAGTGTRRPPGRAP